MLGSLAGRLAGLGDSFTSLLGEEAESPRAAAEAVDLGAGAELLSHFQAGWRRLHEGAEQAGRQADRADRDVAALFGEYDLQWRQVSQLGGLVGQLPALRSEVEGMMTVLAGLEAACQQVEVALLALEDTIDAREAQERQLESRFQLALDQERRRQELEELEQRLEQAYQRKVRDRREAEDASRRELQGRLQVNTNADSVDQCAIVQVWTVISGPV
jgi:hypothetical protein